MSQKDFLKQLIALQTVSSNPSYAGQMQECAQLLKSKLESLGFNVMLQQKNNCAPCIIAQKITDKNAPAIGIYGHYDVQPVAASEAWESPPFELTQSSGKLYARGIADNKGHIAQNIAAIENLIKKGQLNNNIIFVIEGEEEVGSANLKSILSANLPIIKIADVWFVTDTGMRDKETPQIYTHLRGLVYFELKIKTGQKNLHSGICGNLVYNAGQLLAELLATFKNSKTGNVLVDGFYDGVNIPNIADFEQVQKPDVQIVEETQTYALPSVSDAWEAWQSVPRSFWSKFWPSLDVHGINCGHMAPGAATVLPCEAAAKFSCRLVAGQDPKNIYSMINNHIKGFLPDGIEFELTVLSENSAFAANTDSNWFKNVEGVFAKHFKNSLQHNASGGSIPAAAILQNLTEKPVILTGFTLPDDNIHSANENMDVELFCKGIEVLEQIYIL